MACSRSRKGADLEQIRHRALLKEFQQYIDTKGKLNVVRTEALRRVQGMLAEKDNTTIVKIAKRVPEVVRKTQPC